MTVTDDYRVSAEQAQALGRVAVLMGGDSAERSVSLKSGQAVTDALQAAGVDAYAVDVQGNAILRLAAEGGFDRCFIALHGRGGEDGTPQAILDQAGLPYTGSGVLASALGMDKLRTKYAFAGAGLPTPAFRFMRSVGEAEAILGELRAPLGVKPAREGSSIGIRKVETVAELKDAYIQACELDPLVLVEEWITGSEYTVSILGDQALPVIGLATDHIFYDFEAKYLSDDTHYMLPSGLDSTHEQRIRELSLEAFGVIDGCGWGRVDVMQDAAGDFWLLEVNTIPGMTDHSLVPMAAEAAGIGFRELCVRILEQSLEVRA
ncbi:D-alanine--D-alanine ligase [Vreelandella utahensis]|uniref:D-alanine--D-alanine ligase n=1 Tax=Vreelandella halophila TaxID=86177 RepID=UPI000987CFCF|nr:D-alanine--D-alanine ligase [Halomonas utahensis]